MYFCDEALGHRLFFTQNISIGIQCPSENVFELGEDHVSVSAFNTDMYFPLTFHYYHYFPREYCCSLNINERGSKCRQQNTPIWLKIVIRM